MGQPADSDSLTHMRSLLEQGRYRDLLEEYGHGSEATSPAAALAVATAATRLGLFDNGQVRAEQALSAYRRRGDDDGQMRCLNLLGAIAYERGQLTEASDHFATSLELSRRLEDLRSWARASNNLANVSLQQGRVAEAASLYREVSLAYQRLGDRRGLAEAAHNLGVACRELSEMNEAARLGEQAVGHAEVVGDPALLALTLTGQAETGVAREDLEVAAEELDRAERLARDSGDEVGAAEAVRVRAECWLRGDDPVRALECAEQARATAERFGSPQVQGECAAIAARAAHRLGLPVAAQRFAEAERIFLELGAALHLGRLRLHAPPH